MTANKKLWKDIVAIGLMLILLASSIFSVSFAYLSDKHENSITINTANFKTEITTEELSSSNLLASNVFTKTLNYNIISTFDIYFRVYAVTKMQSYNDAKSSIIERTDLIDLINVTNAKIGEDNKYYYVGTSESPQTTASTTLSLKFNFKVSNNLNEELFTDSSYVLNKNLKTTITYYFEYCQESGWDDWNHYRSLSSNGSSQNVNYSLKASSTQSANPTPTSPQPLNHTGELITSQNKEFYNASNSEVGKYALAISNGANDNLLDINKFVNSDTLVNNGDGSYTFSKPYSSSLTNKIDFYVPAGAYTVSLEATDYVSTSNTLIAIEITLEDDTVIWLDCKVANINSTTKLLTSSKTFAKSIKAIRFYKSAQDAIGDYVNFKNLKFETGSVATPYLPYGYGKNLFTNKIGQDVKAETSVDGFVCNLVEGKTYRLSYDMSKGSLNWFKISNDPSGYSCTQFGSPSATTPLYYSSYFYNGITFTHTRNANISASSKLYIYLTINGQKVNTLNSYLAQEIGLKIEEVFYAPAGKNIFTSSVLEFRSSPDTVTYNEDTQIMTINKSSSSTRNVTLYTLTKPIPSGTTVTTTMYVLSGTMTYGSSEFGIGGYHLGSPNSWQGSVNVKQNLKAGDKITNTTTLTDTMTNFMLYIHSSITCDNLQIRVMIELADANNASEHYVTYKPSGTSYVYLNEPLRSTQNYDKSKVYADEIDLSRGVVIRKTESIILTGYTELDGITYETRTAQDGTTTVYAHITSLSVFGRYNTSKPNNGGIHIANVGSCSHFALAKSSVYAPSETVGFSAVTTAYHPYIAIRFKSTDNPSGALKAFFQGFYDAGNPIELVLAYFEPKYDTISIPQSLRSGDEELTLYSPYGTFQIN